MFVGFLVFFSICLISLNIYCLLKLNQQRVVINFALTQLKKNYTFIEGISQEINVICETMTEFSKVVSQDVQNLQILKVECEEFQKSMADFCLTMTDHLALLSQTSLARKELKSPAVSSLNFGKKNDKQKPD